MIESDRALAIALFRINLFLDLARFRAVDFSLVMNVQAR